MLLIPLQHKVDKDETELKQLLWFPSLQSFFSCHSLAHCPGILSLTLILLSRSLFALWQEIASAKWAQEEEHLELVHDIILQTKCFTVNSIVNLFPSHTQTHIMFAEIEQ